MISKLLSSSARGGVLIRLTYVDLEVSIVNVNAVSCLLEVDVANAVNIDIMVGNDTEFRIGSSSLDSSGSSGDVVTLETLSLDRRLLFDVCRGSVVRQARQAVLADINAALGQARGGLQLRGGMSVHVGSKASEAKKDGRLHCGSREAVRELNKLERHQSEDRMIDLVKQPAGSSIGILRSLWSLLCSGLSTIASHPSRKMFPSEFLISIQNPDVTLEVECDHVSQSRFTAS